MSLIQRSKGDNAVRSAAYYSSSKISKWDYSSKEKPIYSKIHLPINAPIWLLDREQLWSAAEAVENRKDAQIACKIRVALQNEFTHEQNVYVLEQFIEKLISYGMVVDANIHMHEPTNPYAIMMLTMRELKENTNGIIEFSKIKNREWRNRSWLVNARELWANLINNQFKEYGFNTVISHLSYKKQGVDCIPTRHRGPSRDTQKQKAK